MSKLGKKRKQFIFFALVVPMLLLIAFVVLRIGMDIHRKKSLSGWQIMYLCSRTRICGCH